jgi:hypothetical protein
VCFSQLAAGYEKEKNIYAGVGAGPLEFRFDSPFLVGFSYTLRYGTVRGIGKSIATHVPTYIFILHSRSSRTSI